MSVSSTKIKTQLSNLQKPPSALSEGAVGRLGEGLEKLDDGCEGGWGRMSHIKAHCLPPPAFRLRLCRTLRGWWLWVGREPTPFFSSLSSCPDAQISFLHSLERKDPLTLPQAPGCQPICWGEGRGRAFPRRSWRANWKMHAPRETHLLDLEGMLAPTESWAAWT